VYPFAIEAAKDTSTAFRPQIEGEDIPCLRHVFHSKAIE
jgi:hypothetical protein